MNHHEIFATHRSTMLAAAYHITGSRDDAEDVVQDAWETWSRVDLDTVRSPHGLLSVMASRLALNAVRTQRRRRESYPGPWLPEPVVEDGAPDWSVLQQEGLGQALDFVLSTLTPEQATAWVLRKVLDVDYPSIAAVLETTPAATRQLVSRAQRAIQAAIGPTLPDQQTCDAQALSMLADAVMSGEVERVASLIAADAMLYSDGGGKVIAARKPLRGPEQIARFLLGIASSSPTGMAPAIINGSAGAVMLEHGQVTTTITLRVGPEGISRLLFVRNPDKLTGITAPMDASRTIHSRVATKANGSPVSTSESPSD